MEHSRKQAKGPPTRTPAKQDLYQEERYQKYEKMHNPSFATNFTPVSAPTRPARKQVKLARAI
jgi:hypothetical protein